MNEVNAADHDLLRQYLAGSEAAFRELVNRHIGLVQTTARRVLSTAPHLADDVTQNVFTDLAKKAATLSPDVVLAGWLHRHSYYLALNTARTENRRRLRERTAMELNEPAASALPNADWPQLTTVLDDALDHLEATDRDAIVLRYLQQLNFRSVGQAIGLSEDAAQKRVARALEKLRSVLTNRGVTVSGTILAASLEANAGPIAVSSSVVAAVSAHAISTAAATGAGLTLLTLKTMITSKLALGIAATVVVVGATTAIISHNNNSVPAPVVAPAAYAAPAAILPARIIAPPVAVVAKVEAPKAAPAPAGNASATPAEVAALRATQVKWSRNYTPAAQPATTASGTLVFSSGRSTLTLSGNNTYTGTTTVSNNGVSVEQLKATLEQFKLQTADIIAQRTAEANGDPDKLAKIEAAQQQYDQFAQDKQKQIDKLEAQAAMGEQNAPASTNP